MTTEISHHSHLNGKVFVFVSNSFYLNINEYLLKITWIGEILDAIKHSTETLASMSRHHEEQSNPGAIPDLNPYTNFGDQLYWLIY